MIIHVRLGFNQISGFKVSFSLMVLHVYLKTLFCIGGHLGFLIDKQNKKKHIKFLKGHIKGTFLPRNNFISHVVSEKIFFLNLSQS